MGHVLTNSGFLHFSQLRLVPLPRRNKQQDAAICMGLRAARLGPRPMASHSRITTIMSAHTVRGKKQLEQSVTPVAHSPVIEQCADRQDGEQKTSVPDTTHVRLSSNDSNPRSRLLYCGLAASHSLFEDPGLASCSMVLPAAIIVEGVLAQLPAAPMARTDARPTAATGHTGSVGTAHTSRSCAILRKVQPPSPNA